MTTLIFTHPACLDHENAPGHPESPARLRVILEALRQPEFAALEWREAPRATNAQLELVHPASYVAAVLDAVPAAGHVALDPDTGLSPGSGEAALRAAGAVCAAVDAVAAGAGANAFCPVRPPGHHAEPDRAMGFCLFSNIAIGALHARKAHGLKRAAVVDFDVHHGNGTEAVFAGDPALFYASTHEWPAYPGTGAPVPGSANIVNVPLAPMSGSAEFRGAMSGQILPALAAFAPDIVLISAGFDAHADDPLASLRLQEEDYAWVTAEIMKVAAESCGGKVVSALEGGYDLTALAASAAAHVTALMGG